MRLLHILDLCFFLNYCYITVSVFYNSTYKSQVKLAVRCTLFNKVERCCIYIICFSCFLPYMAVSAASEMTNRLFRALQFRVNRKHRSTRKWSQNTKKKKNTNAFFVQPSLFTVVDRAEMHYLEQFQCLADWTLAMRLLSSRQKRLYVQRVKRGKYLFT